MNRLYICSINENHYRALLQDAALSNIKITDSIVEANLVLADPPLFAPLLNEASKLQWVQSTFSGCDALLAHSKRDYQLTNVRGIFGSLMSEYVLGQLLSITRHLQQYRTQQSEKCWKPLFYQSLQGKKMVILGTGSIGAHVARTAQCFGMEVTGVSRTGKATPGFNDVVRTCNMTSLFPFADVIVSTLPSTPQTSGLLNQTSLSFCHQAILFNVGRANVIKDQDLLFAIEQGHISHAVLDVFSKEPLEKSHQFWTHPRITLTPHISAQSFPEEIFAIFAQNYTRWQDEETLNYIVDFKKGY